MTKIIPRPEVTKFAIGMESKLRKNDHKTHYKHFDFGYLFERLQDEIKELNEAIKKADAELKFGENSNHWNTIKIEKHRKAIISECYDIANFAMMIADNLKRET